MIASSGFRSAIAFLFVPFLSKLRRAPLGRKPRSKAALLIGWNRRVTRSVTLANEDAGMFVMRRTAVLIVLALSLQALLLCTAAARASTVVVGINMTNPRWLSVADQNAMLDQMQAAGVRVIRCGITPDDKGVDFAKRALARGIKIELLVGFGGYLPGAPTRPYQPAVWPGMW